MDDFRILLAAADMGSLREAAHHKVVHSTVSRRITAFERRARVKLLVRMSTGYKLTAPARRPAKPTLRLVMPAAQKRAGQQIIAMVGPATFVLLFNQQ